VIAGIAIGLAILLTVPVLAFAIIFAVGCACGVAAYHLSRQTVVHYQPLRKAFDPTKESTKAVAVARKLAQETADLQKSYLEGFQLTREQYVAGENGK
jgi:hypothetical protein